MRFSLFLIASIFMLTNADQSLERKKHGIHGIIYKSGLMSLVTFLAIKAKIIIAITVAFTIFILGAKVWATFKYGNLLFDKGCHSYSHEVMLPHPPSSYGQEFVAGPPLDYEGPTPGFGYEKYSKGR